MGRHRHLATIAALVVALVVAACGAEDAPQGDTTSGFTVVLPEAPDGEIGPESTGVPGPTLSPDRIAGDAYVWCDELDLNPNEDAPDEVGVWAVQRAAGPGEGGPFWLLVVSAERFAAGDVVPLPSGSWELVFFYLADVADVSPTVWEFNSDQEESFGTLTLHEMPCQGNGDTLRFTIDGGIGSERNPGYIAWADISGGFTGSITGPPEDFGG